MEGQVIKIISNLYTVKVSDKLYECRARGKFRNDNISPVVGDFVEIDIENNYIMDIKPRRNELKRPIISNVDIALIVTALKKPDLSLNLLDKMLSIIILSNIKPIICFTKYDILTSDEKKNIKKIIKYYKKVLKIPVVFNTQTFNIKRLIKNNLVVLSGQTGAGKSTLLNKIDKNLNLKTSPISESLGRGIHTTRHVELFEIASGLVADTPGFSSLSFEESNIDDIKRTFVEFNNYKCPFKNCNHINESDCEVKKAVQKGDILKSRYENYLKFVSEVQKR